MNRKDAILFLFLFLLLLPFEFLQAQKVGEKTNLLYWATASPNFGLEVAIHKKWSVSASVGYNPWDFPDDTSLRHWLVRVEPRWWICSPFSGHFLGIHGAYAKYNVGNISFIKDLKEHMYKGEIYGGGISYGYHFILKGRWGLELTVGVGYMRLEYDKYICTDCRETMGRFTTNYFGPTTLGVSLIYMLK